MLSVKPVPAEVCFEEENFSRDPRKPRKDSSRVRETLQLLASMPRTSLGSDDLKGRIKAAHAPSLLQEMGDSVHETFSHTKDVVRSQGLPSTVTGGILVAGCGGIELLTLAPKAAGSFFVTPVIKRACKATAITEKGCRAVAHGVQKAAAWVHEQSEGMEEKHGISPAFFTQCVMNLPLLSAVPSAPRPTIPLITLAEKATVFLPTAVRSVTGEGGAKALIQQPSKLLEVATLSTRVFLRSLEGEVKLYSEAAASQGKETAIYIMPETGVASTHIPGFHNGFLRLAQGKKMVVARVTHPLEITRLLSREKANAVSVLWLTTHGDASHIQLKPGSEISGADLSRYWPQDVFAPGAQVVLESCCAGGSLPYGWLNVASQIQQQLGPRVSVIAPRDKIVNEFFLSRPGALHKDTYVSSEGRVSFKTRSGKNFTANPLAYLERLSLSRYETIQRGHVYFVEFPEPIGGHPALVVSSDYVNTKFPYVLIARLTSNTKKIHPDSDVPSFFQSRPGKILASQLHAIPKGSLVRHMGALDEAVFKECIAVIKKVLDVN